MKPNCRFCFRDFLLCKPDQFAVFKCCQKFKWAQWSGFVDFFAVNTVQEALKVRKISNSEILIAAPISPSDFSLASKNNISLCVHSLDYLSVIKNIKLKIHLKINTGTNRLGLSLVDLLKAVNLLRHHKNLIPEGIYTHFHSSDEGSPQSLIQLDIFNQAVSQTKYYFPEILAHCSSSSSALLWPQTHQDMIRIGIALYGLWPDPYVKKHSPGKIYRYFRT